jgi:hypothetical protein
MTKDEKVLSEAVRRHKLCMEFDRENDELAAEDFRFRAGEQWPQDVKAARELAGQPCLTINRLPQFIAQVTGDARQNKPAIKVSPVDSGSDIDTAELYTGLVRNIETQSRATQSYMTAFEHAVTGGKGGWRVLTEYASDDTFEQDIRIARITNPFSVRFDPNAREYDKSDAQYAFVTEWLTKEAFELAYPDHLPNDWENEYRGLTPGEWCTIDKVRVAEYWCKKPTTKTVGLIGGKVYDYIPEMAHLAWEQTRKVKSYKVVRYLLSGHAVLEGPSEWAGKYIPLIPVYGPEEWIDDRARNISLIRYAKDPQRLYNYWQSSITEKVALAPKQPFMVTMGNVAGLESFWKNANQSNEAFLPYNPDPLNGGQAPQRQQPAFINSAELQQAAQSIEDLKATTGLYDASLGNKSNETSGRAIMARQREGDNATFAWIDNLARSIQHTGRILVDLIPRIYDTARVVRIIGEDESAEMVEINQVDPITGQKIHDLTVGKYDVEITVGPSYATKRQEAAESLMAFCQAVPGAAQLAGDLIASAMDWPGADAIAARLKKALPPGMADSEEKDPEAQQAMQQAQQEAMQKQQEAEAIAKAQAAAETQAKQAEAAKKGAETEGVQLDNAKKQVELAAMTGGIQDMVAAEVQRVIMAMMEQPGPSQVLPN